MKFVKSILRIAGIAVAAGGFLAASPGVKAVTQAEMEQAKAIAAKYYVRFANNASGYLDGFTPSSISELESKLANEKDKESLRQFKSGSTPSDYASWDKDKLVAYWSTTYFTDNASRLDSNAANNGLCRKQIKQSVQAMNVSAPAPVAPEPKEEVKPVEPQQPEEVMEIPQPQIVDDAELAAEMADVENAIDEEEAMIDSIQAAPQEEPKSSGTWVYILVLSILVIIVIGLVAYASKTMKDQPKSSRSRRDEDQSYRSEQELPSAVSTAPTASSADNARMREKYAASLADKNDEIRNLSRKLSEKEMLIAQLREENRQLMTEMEKHQSASRPQSVRPAETIHEVFLGRVNANGVFVRADRHEVDGQSMFVLRTSNGVSGTYETVSNPLTESQMLADPAKWLAGGCFAHDLFNTSGRYGVRTESPGTAVFRDGAWRVESKARIYYV